MSDADQTFVVYSGERQVVGGGGNDLLDFGSPQGRASSYYSSATGFGGTIVMNDPATGQSWTLDWTNIENFQGGPGADQIWAHGRTTFIGGGGGDDLLYGAMDTPNAITMFGGEGNDTVSGAEMGDTINGNQGDDVVHGWDRDDWLYGGKDNDVLYGDDGSDHANGNLGDDTVDGGAGADTLYGGQGNDVLIGGAGADFLFGNLGSDTLTGGDGADVFVVALNAYTAPFDGAPDVITDFNLSEGDRIRIEGDVSWRTEQSGADARLILSYGSDETYATIVVLKNVSLPAGEGWLI